MDKGLVEVGLGTFAQIEAYIGIVVTRFCDLLFDDSAYIAPETMPLVSLTAPNVDAWSVIFSSSPHMCHFGLLSAYGPSKGLTYFRRRYYIPASPIVITAFVYLFMAYASSGVFDASWWTDPRQDDAQATLWLWIFVAFNLHIFVAPQRETDAHLGAGDGRSKALAWSIGLAVGLLTLTTALLMHEQQTPDATAVQSSLWLVGWMSALMAGVLLLPLLGFDDGSRPELNWVRWSLMFGPCCGFSCLNMLRSCCLDRGLQSWRQHHFRGCLRSLLPRQKQLIFVGLQC